MPSPLEPPLDGRAPPSWKADMALRMRRLFLLKLVGVSAATWLFFLGYFHTLRFPAYPVFEMPLLALDQAIPFQPQWLAAYLSLWVYVGLAPGLLLTLRELVVYGLWAGLLCLTGLAIFHFWPTAVPLRPIDVTGHAGFELLQGVDAAGNACPSLHVATAVFTALWVARLLRLARAPWALRAANLLWVLAITYSTVAIRQHVVLDVAAGALLGAALAALSLRLSPRLGEASPH